MGVVYATFDHETGLPRALKTLQQRFAANRRMRDLFEAEAATWVRVLCLAAKVEPAHVTFGRAATCDVALADDPEISRVHARLFKSDGGWLLKNLKSTNGTFVGEFQRAQRITAPRQLASGSIFRVRLTRFCLNHRSESTSMHRENLEAAV
jgi:hypothetical protein